MNRWIVQCRVSGGVTGTREAILKERGVIKYFADEASATAEAARLNQQMNHLYSVANFQYWAEPEGGAQ